MYDPGQIKDSVRLNFTGAEVSWISALLILSTLISMFSGKKKIFYRDAVDAGFL